MGSSNRAINMGTDREPSLYLKDIEDKENNKKKFSL